MKEIAKPSPPISVVLKHAKSPALLFAQLADKDSTSRLIPKANKSLSVKPVLFLTVLIVMTKKPANLAMPDSIWLTMLVLLADLTAHNATTLILAAHAFLDIT